MAHACTRAAGRTRRSSYLAPGYLRHQYREWLLTTVANVLDDDLAISSAGLLKDGAIAWVEVSIPDSITTPEGVTFRPNLLATTSLRRVDRHHV